MVWGGTTWDNNDSDRDDTEEAAAIDEHQLLVLRRGRAVPVGWRRQQPCSAALESIMWLGVAVATTYQQQRFAFLSLSGVLTRSLFVMLCDVHVVVVLLCGGGYGVGSFFSRLKCFHVETEK